MLIFPSITVSFPVLFKFNMDLYWLFILVCNSGGGRGGKIVQRAVYFFSSFLMQFLPELTLWPSSSCMYWKRSSSSC